MRHLNLTHNLSAFGLLGVVMLGSQSHGPAEADILTSRTAQDRRIELRAAGNAALLQPEELITSEYAASSEGGPSLLDNYPVYRAWLRKQKPTAWVRTTTRSPRRKIRSLGGNPAGRRDFEQLLVHMKDDDGRVVCSGMVIRSNVVLTAAHCACARKKIRFIGWGKRGQITATNGETALEVDGRRVQIYVPDGAKCTKPRSLIGRDYGLIRLEDPLPRSVSRHRVRFINDTQFKSLKAGNEVFIVGYGEMTNGQHGVKNFIRSPIVDLKCTSATARRINCKAGKEFIAQDELIACPWHNDSGGGAFLNKTAGRPLVGIIARKSRTGRCRDGGVFTMLTPRVRDELQAAAARLSR